MILPHYAMPRVVRHRRFPKSYYDIIHCKNGLFNRFSLDRLIFKSFYPSQVVK